jgi:hypothetical protein
MFETKPLLTNPEHKEYGGAYTSCWINSENREMALKTAQQCCMTDGWEALSIEEEFIAYREQYENESDSLECYDEAIDKGYSLIFHTWDIEAPDADNGSL